MSQQIWNYHTNMNQYSVPIQENYESNSSNFIPYDPNYFYQICSLRDHSHSSVTSTNSPYTCAETQWYNYPVGIQNSCQQVYHQPRFETQHGWQQNSTPENWSRCFSTSECNDAKRQKTHQGSADPTTEVTTSSSQEPVSKARRRARVQISFVNTANGDFTPVIKRKRPRTAFTTAQIEILERQFQKRPYVSPEERRVLTQKLLVSDKVVKVWFQNRRLKNKREREESCSSSSPDSSSSLPDGNIETAFANNTVNEIFNAIEQVISDDLNSGVVDYIKNTVIYEPVSPPAFSKELNTTFVPVDPLTALQNVIHSNEA